MKDFDLEAAKRGAAVCTIRGTSVRIIAFDSKATANGVPQPIIAEFEEPDGDIGASSFGVDGEYFSECGSSNDLMMRDDDYLERLERGEYENHIADASKKVDATVEEELTVEATTCKESLPVGLTKREWFAGMAMAGLCASVGANHGAGFIGAWATSIADALVAELEKKKNLEL